MAENEVRVFTTGEVARYFAVTSDTVLRWIRFKKLRSFCTPGGHRRITAEDFREFLEKNKFPVDEKFFGTGDLRRILIAGSKFSTRETRLFADLKPKVIVERALDGHEAAIKIGSLRPDLVIVNEVEPNLDAVMLCRAIRNNPATATIKVLAIVDESHGDSENNLYAAGADVCLSKKISTKRIRLEMERLFEDSSQEKTSTV